ncbi:hypothetical protein RKD42_004100 [Streptomyces ambofaciens]
MVQETGAVAEFAGGGLALGVQDVGDQDVRPGGDRLPGGFRAEAAGAAGDDHVLAGQVGHGVLSSSVEFRGGRPQKWVPPSIRTSVPVMNRPSSLPSIATTDATVSGPAKPRPRAGDSLA